MGERSSPPGGLSARVRQAFGPGHGSGLDALDRGSDQAVSRRRVRVVRRRSIDDRFGLARVYSCCGLCAHAGCGERVSVNVTVGRSLGRAWRQRTTVLESEIDAGECVRHTLYFLLLSILCASCTRQQSASGITIAVIPKGTSHVFWQSIHAGAAKAAQELGVDIIWRGPLREDAPAPRIAEVEGFITRGVSGIVLAPLDEAALVGPVGDAMRAKIPVVIIDSGLKGGEYVSFVATDNRLGGRMAAQGLAKMLPQGGRIVVLRYAEG